MRRGFTLVEILASLAFMGILMPVLISALLASNRAGIMSERSMNAVQLAENQLGELTLANAWTSAPSGGDFGKDWPGYRWEMAQKDWESGSMVELTVNVFFKVQGTEHFVPVSTLVSPSLTGT